MGEYVWGLLHVIINDTRSLDYGSYGFDRGRGLGFRV